MGRPKRITLGGYVYHVLNRANGRLRIFRKNADFEAFEAILAAGLERVDMRICGYCIMSNHWHLLLWPREDGDLSEYMRWISLTHTQRYHASHGTTGIGHLYQGLEKPFSLTGGPVVLPANWSQLVSRNIALKVHDRICNSINRGVPLGEPDWVKRTAAKMNLESTTKPRGRPKKSTGHL